MHRAGLVALYLVGLTVMQVCIEDQSDLII